MSDYNLIDEPWISVVVDYKGTTKLVGLKEFFEHAHEYIALAGDMPTQDFAVMRFLLAILHTVFSRYDAHGEAYEMIELNDRMQQIEKVDLEDEEDYEDALMETWKDLWNAKKFPDIVAKYLDAWHDRFYLFDDKYPFYQVTKEEIDTSKISKASPSKILGKNINRLISESGNKIALFSPKYDANNNKGLLTYDELTRWLITFQSYTGLSDKVIFGNEKYKASKGWLFDLGGVYLSSDNLYQTLILNLRLINRSNVNYNYSVQKPCWENAPSKLVEKAIRSSCIDNIAELYTTWSRAIYFNKFNMDDVFQMEIVKLPDIKHEDMFLEPMTLWKYNNVGDNKGKFTPRKHQLNKSLWRSFGLMTKFEEAGEVNAKIPKRKPGIIEWLNDIDESIKNQHIKINAISMEDDGNATSWVPINEVEDKLDIGEFIVNDLQKNGWVDRINNIVDRTKDIIEKNYRAFLNDIAKIRGIESGAFTSSSIESMYFKIDKPFRDWLTNINYDDNKDEKEQIWNKELKNLVIRQAKIIIEQASPKDFTGIIENDSVKNIVTAYNNLMSNINKKL